MTAPGQPNDAPTPTATGDAEDPRPDMTAVGAQMGDVEQRIRGILRDHARLQGDAFTLEDDANLFDAGMSSHATVSVLIALEETFAVEFPDAMLTRSVFESVANLRAAIAALGVSP
jgi:acyl carrier protein